MIDGAEVVVLTIALGLAAFGTAVLSATLGMAGGLVLMGVYTALLPVSTAMVLHGTTQLVSNGSRAILLRDHVRWGGVAWYVLGASAGVAVASFAQVRPTALGVYLGLGIVPFAARLFPALDFGDRRMAALCGFLVTAVQLACGVAGPILDVFFVRTALGRREIVATKAVTQVLAHGIKIAWFAGGMGRAPVGWFAVTVVAAVLGSRAGSEILARTSDDVFRRVTRTVLLAIGAGYLGMAAWTAAS